MSVFGVVKGYRLRVTKTNSCGKPIEGPANRLVTSGFVSAELTPVTRDRQDLEQANAEGRICVTTSTPPERKWYTVALELCRVDTELLNLLTGWAQVLDYADNPIGFEDQKEVQSDFGVAIELWTGAVGDDDCPVPTDDSIFSLDDSGLNYGYLLTCAKEFQLGNVRVAAEIANFTLTGLTYALPQWGRGPYNVAKINSDGDAGRMLLPMNNKSHFRLFETPIAPPEPTDGAVALDITTKFTSPNYYIGDPSGNTSLAVDVAPEQDTPTRYSVSVTGIPTGGDFQVLADGLPATIVFNSTNTQAKTALAGIDDGHPPSEWTVTGGALPGTPLVITPPVGVVLTLGTNGLTGGTAPAPHIAEV